jgi:hypothetical protein
MGSNTITYDSSLSTQPLGILAHSLLDPSLTRGDHVVTKTKEHISSVSESKKPLNIQGLKRATHRSRTDDLLITNQLLYQLS